MFLPDLPGGGDAATNAGGYRGVNDAAFARASRSFRGDVEDSCPCWRSHIGVCYNKAT